MLLRCRSGERSAPRGRRALTHRSRYVAKRTHAEPIDAAGESPGSTRTRRTPFSFRAPGILTSLVIVALVPIVVAAVLCSTVVLNQLSIQRDAAAARQSSFALDSLLRASVSLYREYEPSEALVAARAYGISEQQLDALLHTDAAADLARARRDVNIQKVFGPGGQFSRVPAELVGVRRSVDDGTTTQQALESFFTALSATVERAWSKNFDALRATSEWVDAAPTQNALTALGHTFTAFTAGLGEETLHGGGSLETVLTSQATPAETLSLVVSHDQFTTATDGFPHGLGPASSKSWRALRANSFDDAFMRDVQLGIATSLGHTTPPLAGDSDGIADLARAEVAWAGALTDLALSSSTDLRAATVSQANAATRELTLTVAAFGVLLLAELAVVLFVGRQVRRPLARLVTAATLVREGELELPHLPESGPKELALAASAFNEMSSTLQAVQEQAIALANAEFDDPALQRSLPGRTGTALQSAFVQLHSSVRDNERRRLALTESATRDYLTGLLNRGAALEALRRDLASVHRSNGELELTLLFIDVDHLKAINDTFGHDRGDVAIQLVADALRESTRASDVVARLGGDEFIVGSLAQRGVGISESTAERIGAQLAELQLGRNDQNLVVGCSIGAVVSEPTDDRIELLIERADRALYVAKGSGRGLLSWSATR